MNIYDGRIINNFLEPNKRQYTIPVYQRDYIIHHLEEEIAY